MGGNSKIDAVQTRCSGQAAGGQQETKVQNPECTWPVKQQVGQVYAYHAKFTGAEGGGSGVHPIYNIREN